MSLCQVNKPQKPISDPTKKNPTPGSGFGLSVHDRIYLSSWTVMSSPWRCLVYRATVSWCEHAGVKRTGGETLKRAGLLTSNLKTSNNNNNLGDKLINNLAQGC